MSTVPENDDRLVQLRREVAAIEAAMHAVAQDALLAHQRANQPLVVWRDGQVVLIPAEDFAATGATATS